MRDNIQDYLFIHKTDKCVNTRIKSWHFFVLLFVLIIAPASLLFPDYNETFSLHVSPAMSIPIGRDIELYSFGGGGSVSGVFPLPFFRPIKLSLNAGYNFSPIKATGKSLSLVSAGGGASFSLTPVQWLAFSLFAKGGYFYSFFNDDPAMGGGNPWVYGGVGVSFRPAPSFSIGLQGGYRNFFGLYNDVVVSIGTSVHIGVEKTGEETEKPHTPQQVRPQPLIESGTLTISAFSFDTIFPVFFKYYDDHPVGTVVLENNGDTPAEGISVTFYVKQYMDNPKQAEAPTILGPGEKAEVAVYGLFNKDVLEITEGTKASTLISLEYSQAGEKITEEFIETLRFNNRNAVTWDDDRKASAFVTAKDPAVMRFSKNVTGFIQAEKNRAIDANLQQAIAFHEALDIYGISYVIDPTTPYQELSKETDVIDYLQFPKQTLEYLAGDCDDLSILYAALLESVGIETSFITIPGHIYVAFALTMGPKEIRTRFSRPDDCIVYKDTVWIPVEITLRNEGFLEAWRKGAKQWREHHAKGQANLYPIHDGWALYEPVGFPGTPMIAYPGRDTIVDAFRKELTYIIEEEIRPQVNELQAKIKERQGDIRYMNKLGVVYARYGLDEHAEEQFLAALEKKSDFYPSLINMGNIYYLKKEYRRAREYYERAERISPENPTVLLCISRINHEIENYGTAREAYEKLQKISPVLAEKFAYLNLRGEESTRAAEVAGIEGAVVWAEGE